MSSICGVLRRDRQPLDPGVLDGMVTALRHWDADCTGGWSADHVALGHVALWTTPEASRERCPFVRPESGIVVTADARIDNRDDLMAALGSPGPPDRIGDHEIIALAYEKWGEDCAARLVGDFAFALWDPHHQRLFCARDPLGLRPFYYFVDAGCFVFGTESKAILRQPGVPGDWNTLRFALFVIGGHLERDRTQFRAIRSLEPATSLVVEPARFQLRQYWRLDPDREIRFPRDDDYVEAFEELFQRAVDARLRSSHRVGSMLSGGLDATTMTAFARSSRHWSDGTLAYTWALAPGDDWFVPDERRYVDAYLHDAPIRHHYVVADPTRIFEDRPELRHLHDGPNWDLTHYALTPTYAHARSEGIRVLLFGDGGDETASHFASDYLLALAIGGNWPALGAEVRAQAAVSGRPARAIWKGEVFDRLTRVPAARGFAWQRFHHMMAVKATCPERWLVPLARSPEVAACGLIEHLHGQRPGFGRAAWRHPVRYSQIAILTGITAMSSLAVRKRNTSVLHGIECRYPYLDRRVVEFCVALPPRQHRHLGWPRRLLRRTADARLPAAIARRLDKTLTLPDLARGIMKTEGDLRQRFDRWAGDRRITSLVDVAMLRRHLRALVESCERRGAGEPQDTGSFCRAVLLASFLEREAAVV